MTVRWRIIMHWTAGADGVIPLEADAYHFIVGRDGTITEGKDKPGDNVPPLREGAYAAHTKGLNGYSIGVAMDGMANAVERPFDQGRFPLTEKQVDAFCRLVARLADQFDIPVVRDRVLTHAEVQPTLGVKQNNKWDITWLPGMAKPRDPIAIGDELRRRIRLVMP